MNGQTQRQIIFCGGVHGVGKTTLLSSVASGAGWMHAKASHLIERARGGKRNWSQGKRVKAISENQRLLIEALGHEELADQNILLDGHFTLRRESGEVEEIELSTFVNMSPDLLFLCDCSVPIIESRLKGRGTTDITTEEIERMQIAERAHAHAISDALEVPLLVVPMRDLEAASSVAKAMTNIGM